MDKQNKKKIKDSKTEENNYLFLERKYEYVTKIFFLLKPENVEINTLGYNFKKVKIIIFVMNIHLKSNNDYI